MTAGNSANNSTVEDKEPLSPPVDLTPPRSSSFSTPGNSLSNQSASKFNIFADSATPLQRSTNALNQNVSTAPPFLRDPNELHSTIPAGLVDINLALGALDLDFGSARAASAATSGASKNASSDKEAADISSSSIAEGEDDATVPMEGEENMQHPFGPGLMHQPMHPFFPINEFGQPLHAAFSPGEHIAGGQSAMVNAPWPAKPGQHPFSAPMGGNAGLDSMSHTPPLPPPGMIPMRPFDFHPDGMAPPPMSPHDAQFMNGIPFPMKGPQMKDGRGNYPDSPSFPPMENGPFGQQPHPLQNSQMWPPLNGGPQNMDGGFANSNMPPNGMGPVNGNGDRRFQYYQNGDNIHPHHHHHHNNNHHHHHHNNNHNHGGRRMMGNRRRGEDAARFANAKLDDFIGQIYSLCKDQHGCRFLQKQLDLDASNAAPIFEETQMHVVELMIDPFGNYLVQKLLEKVSDEHRITLVKNAAPEFVTIALDPHGTRALQKLVECINSDEEAEVVVTALKNDVVLLSRDLNGNHVVQKCLQRLEPKDSQFIFDTAAENLIDIATHRHGCCVLQRCLDHGSNEQCKELSLNIAKFTTELSFDAFGNYVVQYVLAKDQNEAIEKIMEAVKENFISLTLHKFGSNVIEKCLRVSKLSGELIEELLKNKSEMVKLLNDPFGNYVLQTTLDVAKEDQFEKLSELLTPLLPQVRNTPHGRRILARLQPNTAGKPFPPHHSHHHMSHRGPRQSTSGTPTPPAVAVSLEPAVVSTSN